MIRVKGQYEAFKNFCICSLFSKEVKLGSLAFTYIGVHISVVLCFILLMFCISCLCSFVFHICVVLYFICVLFCISHLFSFVFHTFVSNLWGLGMEAALGSLAMCPYIHIYVLLHFGIVYFCCYVLTYFCIHVSMYIFMYFCIVYLSVSEFMDFCISTFLYVCTSVFLYFCIDVLMYFCISE